MSEYKCTECLDEPLVRVETLGKAIGHLLVCPSCDIIFVSKERSNDWLGDRRPIHLVEAAPLGADSSAPTPPK